MNRAAQVGPLVALADQARLAEVQAHISNARDRIAEIARANGLTTLPSATNFVSIDYGRDADFAKSVLDALIADGIFVRMPFAAPRNRYIRVSCAPPSDPELFVAQGYRFSRIKRSHAMTERNIQRAPDFTSAAITMLGVNLLWIFFVIWVIWGFVPVLVLAAPINRGINRFKAVKGIARPQIR